ncbi:MAG: hypothetical protein NDF54_09150 [archaeon GB-1867-035]|nr:hypothetical protein [Candidatus Culexmicrobium profundum]
MSEIDIYVGLDVEGPLVNPRADFAWLVYDNLLSEEIKAIFPREVCEFYDSKYDDGRYLWELLSKKRKKYSTGKWPLVSLCLAVCDGINDEKLIEYARKTTQENPGTSELLKYLMEKTNGNVYLITSSYPAVPLLISYKYDISNSKVVSMGLQGSSLWRDSISFEEEVHLRSPASKIGCPLDDLERFLIRYLYICECLGRAYENENKTQIHYLLKVHDSLFNRLHSPQKEVLEYMFLEEKGCMGSHRKVEAMKSRTKKNTKWIYIGDGIVDAMALKFADYGISINMTNTHALFFSKLNVATTNVSTLIPILDSIFSNKFEPKKLKKELKSSELEIFTRREIHKYPLAVTVANKRMKNTLKELYKPVKP